jgi:RHS repeat-associated protein
LYNQSWDAENRLKVVTNTVTGEVTKFVYDGDGARVKQIYSGTYTSTTIYLGAPVEINILGAPLPPPTATIPPTMTYRAYLPLVAGGQPVPPRTQPFANETWKMYYAVGNQVIAMRSLTMTGSVVNYLHSDHLGSTSLATDASGAAVPNSRQMYYPYGEPRVKGTSLPTDIGFTGQRTDDATGLMYYQARYYAHYLNRWLSPDTIVPDPKNPQSLNRFSYVNNNPLKHTDPSGHCGADVNSDGAVDQATLDQCIQLRDKLSGDYHLRIAGLWKYLEMQWLGKALADYKATIGAKGWGRLIAPKLKAIERGVREGGIIGAYDEQYQSITILGEYIVPWPEDESLDDETNFKQTIAHELTHPLLKSRTIFLDWFMEDVGWGGFRGGVWGDIPNAVSSYGRQAAEKSQYSAPEEDFAEYFSRSIYQPQRALDVDYREALTRIRSYVWWDYVHRGPGR